MVNPEISVETIDPLGIVAGLVDEMGIVEILNKRLGIDIREKVSYNLGQRQPRLALAEQNQTIPNQLGKPTSSPTLRWVFLCFIFIPPQLAECG